MLGHDPRGQSGGDVAKQSAIRQISNPRLEVTGGTMGMCARTTLVFGQDFQGGYSIPVNLSAASTFTQIYSDDGGFGFSAWVKPIAPHGPS